jgi:hypothetical protein
MRKILLIGLIIAAMAVPFVSSAQVEAGAGAMQISGKVKWLYTYRAEDEDALPDAPPGPIVPPGTFNGNYWGMSGVPVENFATTNVEVSIAGAVGENVRYLIELQSANSNAGWLSNAADMGAVGVRQAALAVSDVVPMTTVYIGTGNLPVGIYQPRATNDLDLILLPLINITTGVSDFNGDGIADIVMAPIGLGWQATGVMLAVQPMDTVELDIGYYNGYAGGAPNADIDLEKSWLIKLGIKPAEGSALEFAYLMENWQEPKFNFPAAGADPLAGGHQEATALVISGCYITDQLEANFDWMTRTVENYALDDKGSVEDLVQTGYQVTLGFWATEALELLVRYEFIDPNTMNDDMSWVQSEYDDMTAITVGVNSRLNDNAEVSLNYVMLQEPGSGINVKKGKVPPYIAPPAVPPAAANIKYQQIDNDMILVQVQVWQ